MKEKLIDLLPVLGLASVTFIIVENIIVRRQNKKLTAKIERQDAILSLYDADCLYVDNDEKIIR